MPGYGENAIPAYVGTLHANNSGMKKQLSPEQQRRREERKARLADLIKKVASMSDVEKVQLMAGMNIVNCEGHALSVRNQLLIMWQVGRSATIVGGFRQWLKQGRCVRKGEHGASILFPRTFGEPGATGEHEHETALGAVKVQFLSGTVFDVSQTDLVESEVAA